MYETTTPDPLESTVPDPVRRRRMPARRRRAVEAWAVALLVPATLVTYWIDGSHLGRGFETREHVTVIPHGTVATIGHTHWRMLGRSTTPDPAASTPPPGSVRLTLLLQVNVLDAQGVKDATSVTYQVRDRQGHIWDALGQFPDFKDPAPGDTLQDTVTANVPPRLAAEVVLEVRASAALGTPTKGPLQVLRFAH